MARGAVMSASASVCRLQPVALALLLVACFAGHAYGSCLQYGHSCWGAHGKRSGEANAGDAAVAGDGLLGPLAPASSSSSSSPSSTDSETLWVLSKLMARKALERKDAEGSVADTKDSNIWQRLLEAKKNSKASEQVQQSGDSKTHSESNFDLADIENAKKAEEVETRNNLESGGKPEREDEDDLALEDFEDYPFDDDEEEQGADGKTRDSRRYRYKLQKHWANRRKNRRPYRRPYYYYYKRW